MTSRVSVGVLLAGVAALVQPACSDAGDCHEEFSTAVWTPIDKVGTSARITSVWVSDGWGEAMQVGGGPADVWLAADDGTIHGLGPFGEFYELYQAAYPLRSLWGSRDGHVWVVGDGGTILHWRFPDPTTEWTSQDSGVSTTLNGIWGSESSSPWVVGDEGTVLRGDSQTWTSASPAEITPGVNLTAIWGAGSEEFWVGTPSSGIYRARGGVWTLHDTGLPGSLHAIAGTATDDVWAVGDAGGLAHWNGLGWSPQTSGVASSINAVWTYSASYAWAVGAAGVALSWDGSRWREVTSTSTEDLLTVAGGMANGAGVGTSLTDDAQLLSLWSAGSGGTVLAFTQPKSWICSP